MELIRCAVAGNPVILRHACATINPPLPTPHGNNATTARRNFDGIVHHKLDHWSIAKDHFTSAVEADSNLAEVYFNLGLAPDKLNL